MGVDLYCGPLCRYYANDFKTKAAQLFGDNHTRLEVGPDGKTRAAQRKNPSRFRDATLGWQKGAARYFHKRGAERARWDDLPKGDYTTEQFRTWRELVVFAAYAEIDELPTPTTMIKDERVDAAMTMLYESTTRATYASISIASVWVPVAFDGPIVLPLPDEREAAIGSTAALRMEAEKLARQELGIEVFDAPSLSAASADQSRSPLERDAAAALWSLCRVTDFALEHAQPIIVDY